MNAPDTEPGGQGEDQVIERLVAYEEALATGKVPSRRTQEMPAELVGALSCLDQLDQLWPTPSSKTPLQPTEPLAVPAGTDAIPQQLGRFQIQRKLGEGGCGIVFLASDPVLHRPVALKVPRPEALFTPSLRERFLLEAQAAAGLDHPYVVPVYEAGEAGMVCFIASAYCPGTTLRAWRRAQSQKTPVRSAADLVARLAEAVDYTHQKGVVHRDLKPANVMLVPQRAGERLAEELALEELTPRITDFGLAKFYSEETNGNAGMTRTGTVFGTPQYMSPEQAQGRRDAIGPATDVYALGVILYELLTGQVPFQAGGELDLLNEVVSREPPPPTSLRPAIHPDLETICLKCLQKNPARRFASAGALAAELRRFLAGEPIQTRPISRTERLWRWCKRNPTRAALVALTCLTLFVLVPGILWYGVRLRRAERQQGISDSLAKAAKKAEDEAQRARRAAQETAQTQEYFALVHQAREKIAARQTGWRQPSLDNLAKAARSESSVRDLVDLRSLAADASAGLDLQEASALELPGPSQALAVDESGALLAVGPSQPAQASSVWVLEYPSGKVLHELRWAESPAKDQAGDVVRTLAFHSSGRFLAAGTRGGKVLCWDLKATPPRLGVWQAAGGQALDRMQFLPDGPALLTLSAGGNLLQRWSLEVSDQGIAAKETARHEGGLRPEGVALSPDGKTLACINDDRLEFLDPFNLQPLKNSWIISADAVRFHPHGRILALVREGKILFMELETEEELRRLPDRDLESAHEGRVDGLHFSKDGQLLISSSSGEDDRKIKVWEVSSGRLAASAAVGSRGPLPLAWHEGDRTILAGEDGRVRRIQVTGQQGQQVIGPFPRPVQALAFDPGGAWLACGGAFRQKDAGRKAFVALWDLGGQRVHDYRSYFFAGPIHPPSLAFSPDNTALLATGWSSVLYAWELKDQGQRQLAATLPYHVHSRPGSGRLWAVVEDNTVQSWSWPEGQEQARWVQGPAGSALITSLAVGDRWLVVGGRDGQTRLLAAKDGQLAKTLEGMGHPVRALAMDRAEQRCFVGSQKGELALVSVPEGKILQRRLDHADGVEAIAVHPQGQLLATAGRDRRVVLYRLEQDRAVPLVALSAAGPITGLAFHPDGRRLAAAVASESSVRLWDLPQLQSMLREVGMLEASAW